ncbi:MAG: hypothetical protein IPJ69_08590 [Deltaproteobacteria bacterium]|nr:MAG: hypothetical protein IPJ69_08590 [Deltaproteobacteria bacterium]
MYSPPKNLEDEKWIEAGVDIWMIRENLKLSFKERVSQHQDTLNFIDHLHKSIIKNDVKPPKLV